MLGIGGIFVDVTSCERNGMSDVLRRKTEVLRGIPNHMICDGRESWDVHSPQKLFVTLW